MLKASHLTYEGNRQRRISGYTSSFTYKTRDDKNTAFVSNNQRWFWQVDLTTHLDFLCGCYCRCRPSRWRRDLEAGCSCPTWGIRFCFSTELKSEDRKESVKLKQQKKKSLKTWARMFELTKYGHLINGHGVVWIRLLSVRSHSWKRITQSASHDTEVIQKIIQSHRESYTYTAWSCPVAQKMTWWPSDSSPSMKKKKKKKKKKRQSV